MWTSLENYLRDGAPSIFLSLDRAGPTSPEQWTEFVNQISPVLTEWVFHLCSHSPCILIALSRDWIDNRALWKGLGCFVFSTRFIAYCDTFTAPSDALQVHNGQFSEFAECRKELDRTGMNAHMRQAYDGLFGGLSA